VAAATATAASSRKRSSVSGKARAGDANVTYDFKKDGKYDYESGKTKYTGKWKAVDDKTIEEKFKLTEEEAEALKPVVKAMNEVIDLANKVPGVNESKIPEPVKGENTWKVRAEVKGDELTLGGLKLKKAK
jgi:hypothetical protein